MISIIGLADGQINDIYVKRHEEKHTSRVVAQYTPKRTCAHIENQANETPSFKEKHSNSVRKKERKRALLFQ